ncbi:MAG: GNAT family N-acetyltransferase [Candidatus Bathyarchaeia archaeon]
MLRVAALDGSTESLFWDVANRDPLELFWFIYDWKLYRDVTKIWLALDEAERVAGLLLLHRDTIIQFRGSREAVKALLDYASAKGGFEVQAPLDCEELVTGKFGSEGKVHMVLMKLQKGEEKIRISTEPARLGVEDAEEVAALLREADPLWWGEITAERLAGGSLKEALWFGIRQDKHIVSVGSTRLTNLGISNIGIVATKEGYRNKGYATSVTSALVKEILKVSNTAIIHVLADNKPAVRTYTKVGFKPYKTYLAIRSKT